jgi:hypothetical protein
MTGRRYKRKDHYAASKIQAVVRRALAKNIETKSGLQTSSDGIEILHNNFVVMNSTPLATTQGDMDVDSGLGQRIGDKINLKGVSIRFMTELNERYSDVSFRFLFVKAAKGDVPTRASLYNAVSGNKMLDTLNRERYTILKDHWFKIRAANQGTDAGFTSAGSGTYDAPSGNQTLSRATKITKIWIPGNKIVKGGVLQYEDNATQLKFFDYYCLLFAYSNYSTNQDLWNVGRLNDSVIQMYFKDA